MKLLPFLLFAFFLPADNAVWRTDFNEAKQEAQKSGKDILISFSGSDWCIPCIRMHKTIFESLAFQTFAEKDLVLINADFPRLSKHKLAKTQQKMNDALADKYNPGGKFPYTVLADVNGKVLRSWEGCPTESPEQFTEEISTIVHAGK